LLDAGGAVDGELLGLELDGGIVAEPELLLELEPVVVSDERAGGAVGGTVPVTPTACDPCSAARRCDRCATRCSRRSSSRRWREQKLALPPVMTLFTAVCRLQCQCHAPPPLVH